MIIMEYLYQIYNHNNVLLGEFKTLDDANKELFKYTCYTGNASYIKMVRK